LEKYLAAYKDKGAFAEYLVVDSEKILTLPDNLSFPDAATMSICANTAFQMLYQSQSMARPSNPVRIPTPVSSKAALFPSQYIVS
jgi:NADPH:quinone reductase-like Zn-dependent oxidoreductase